MKWLALLALFSAPALAQDHENHDWLQFKMNERGQSCCSGGKSGDCQPVEFDAYTEDNKGGVNYGRFYFPPGSVFPVALERTNMTLPKQYAWLAKEGSPRLLVEALKTFGTQEAKGSADNPTILWWAKSIGLKASYRHDSVPWCGLTVAYWAAQAGWPHAPRGNALWARNWLAWEDPAPEPMLGDVLVFARGSSGHVGLYAGEDRDAFHVLGGNQGDRVSFKRIARSRLLGARRCHWRVNQPPSVRSVQMTAAGPISANEA